MKLPAKIMVTVEMDRMGNIEVATKDPKYGKAFGKAQKAAGGPGHPTLFFNDGGESEEFLQNLSAKQRKDVEAGYPVTMGMNTDELLNAYGYDLADTFESVQVSLRSRNYVVEGDGSENMDEPFQLMKERASKLVPFMNKMGSQYKWKLERVKQIDTPNGASVMAVFMGINGMTAITLEMVVPVLSDTVHISYLRPDNSLRTRGLAALKASIMDRPENFLSMIDFKRTFK